MWVRVEKDYKCNEATVTFMLLPHTRLHMRYTDTIWQAVCNKIRCHSDVDIRLSHVDVRLSDVDIKAKTSTWNSDDEKSTWK